MPDNRTDNLVQLAQDTARRITGSHTAWMAYLQTAARLYKYPYHEQLLIFAQRPQATACAGYEVWKNTMRRYVRRGAKGIALLDTSGDAPRLRYVFDVADTGELSQSRSLNLWKLSEENAQAVSLSLENGYDVPAREGLERQLRAISSQLAGACWVDRKQEIFDIVKQLNEAGTTILLVEQNANMALSIADRAYVLEIGTIKKTGTGAELLVDDDVRKAYLGG